MSTSVDQLGGDHLKVIQLAGLTADARILGATYTREWVAQFMLDAAGYRVGQCLSTGTIIEPSCGDGVFLVEIVRRLLDDSPKLRDSTELEHCIRAYDISPTAVSRSKAAVRKVLHDRGFTKEAATELVTSWVHEADFLLAAEARNIKARWVVGNPPYVRIHRVPKTKREQYRAAWRTMSGRADIYVGFYEAGLASLTPDGILVYVCSDRWMKTAYGAELRTQLVRDRNLSLVIELHEVDLFESRVHAYPAITVLTSQPQERTEFYVANQNFDLLAGRRLLRNLNSGSEVADQAFELRSLSSPSSRAAAGWSSGSQADLAHHSSSQALFPTLLDAGVKVRSGMATGADRVYILPDAPDVEPNLMKGVIGPADLTGTTVEWQGRWIVTPWVDGNVLASLSSNPRLGAYLESHRRLLERRYVAQRHPDQWWRTIDKPRLSDYHQPKLIVADINIGLRPHLDLQGFVPMHTLYYLQSPLWDLCVLGGLLMSSSVERQLSTMSTKLNGGRIRVSAQYLKRIRIPLDSQLTGLARSMLRVAFLTNDRPLADAAARRIWRGDESYLDTGRLDECGAEPRDTMAPSATRSNVLGLSDGRSVRRPRL